MGVSTGTNTEFASMMPLLSEDANIQEALQTYHYGNTDPTSASISPNFTDETGGIAGKLKSIKDTLSTLSSGKVDLSTFTTAGDLLVGTGSGTATRLAIGSSGMVLRVSGGGGVVWESLDSSYLTKTGGTLTGNLTISKSSPFISLEASASGQKAGVKLSTLTGTRWEVTKTTTAESGSDEGSNFAIYRYSDSGINLDAPFFITRSTGKVNVLHDFMVYENTSLTGTLTVSGTTSLQTTTVLSPTSGGTYAARNISYGTGSPTGGADGDIYIQY